MLAKSTGGAMVKAGGDSWFFLTADYAFGKQLQADTTAFVQGAGGKVLGSSAYPFPGTTDFSSFLVQAQSAGAKVLGLCNAGADTVNSIKQAHEFGVNQTMKIAALLMFVTDVHALGLDVAQGLNLTESFYWDLNDRHARLHRPSEVEDAEQLAEHGACRLLLGDAALPEDRRRHGRGGGEEGRRRDGGADEEDAGRGRLLRQDHHPRGRPQPDPPISSR